MMRKTPDDVPRRGSTHSNDFAADAPPNVRQGIPRQRTKSTLPAALRDLNDVAAPCRFLPLIDEVAGLLETLRQHAQRPPARSPTQVA